jgi:site-specific DNA-methyltransferase (adenine-specific)
MKIKIKDIKRGKRVREDFGDIKELAENIKQNGLIVPIVLDKKKQLVDGERRIKAYDLLKLKEIEYTEYPEYNIEAEASANTGKHFTIIEAVSVWNAMEKSLGGKGQTVSDSDKVRTRASKLTGYSHDSLSKAKYVLDNGDKEDKELLKTGMPINKIYDRIKVREELKKIEEEKQEPEEKYFEIIYADPPWKYNRNVGEGIASEEYPTMDMVDIRNYLKQNKIIPKENSILFLWVTFPMLEEGLELIRNWGFEYKTCGFNWIKLEKNGKPFFGIGHYTKSNSELCLIGVRGKGLRILDNTISQVIMTPKDKHSKKPDIIPKLITRLVGDRKLKAELFARNKREGWDVYGNEVK